ncbi:MAG: Ig-like domain-containing protein [Cyanobacteria bacterium P01_D01_bin.156]
MAYNFEIIASTGKGFDTLENAPSINNNGQVAFVGTQAGDESIFVGDASETLVDLEPNRNGTPIDYGPGVQINDLGQVVSNYKFSSSSSLYSRVGIWNSQNPGISSNIALGSTNTNEIPISFPGGFGEIPGITLPSPIPKDYDFVAQYPTIDNSGKVIFSGIMGANRFLSSPRTNGAGKFDERAFPGKITPQVMAADNGFAVLRFGDNFGDPEAGVRPSPIVLINERLGHSKFIASGITGKFTQLGAAPGISDDGKIIAFYGNLSTEGADDLNTRNAATLGVQAIEEAAKLNPGEGIFAAVNNGSDWIYQRIAGISGNGFLDPGEIFEDSNNNGQLDVGEDRGRFSGFEPDQRVGVSSIFSDPLETSTVVYSGYSTLDADARKGIYTSDLSTYNVISPSESVVPVYQPKLVVQVDDTINGLDGKITDLNLHDPINSSGNLAFWVETEANQGIVSAIDPSISIDRWWATVGDEPITVDFTFSVPEAGNYHIDIDFGDLIDVEGISDIDDDWFLTDSAKAEIFYHGVSNGEFANIQDSSGFVSSFNIDLNDVPAGKHTLSISGFKVPTVPVVEEVNFTVSSQDESFEENLRTFFVADHPDISATSEYILDVNGESQFFDVEELIDHFAPALIFNEGERFAVPFDVSETWQGSRLATGNADDSLELSGSYANESNFYNSGNTPAAIYASVLDNEDRNEVAINYYFHYPRSNWAEHGGFNTHEGDWEGITIFLEKTGNLLKPDRVSFAQHVELDEYSVETTSRSIKGQAEIAVDTFKAALVGGLPAATITFLKGQLEDLFASTVEDAIREEFIDNDGSDTVDWEELAVAFDQQVLVFPGLGGHASYPRIDETFWPSLLNPSNSFLPRERHFGNGSSFIPSNGQVQYLPRVGTGDSDVLDWLRYPGLWGNPDLGDFLDDLVGDETPRGPVFLDLNKLNTQEEAGLGQRWLDPWAWANEDEAPESIRAQDDFIEIDEDGIKLLDPRTNDEPIDPQDNPQETLTIDSLIRDGLIGQAKIIDGQIIRYEPNGEFEDLAEGETATDTFSYRVSDSENNSDTAVVTVTITGVNDAPITTDDPGSTDEDNTTFFLPETLLRNDIDIDSEHETLEIVSVSPTADTKGIVSILSNRIGYDPDGQFDKLSEGQAGFDSFTYTIRDDKGAISKPGFVRIGIQGVNDAPSVQNPDISVNENGVVTIGIDTLAQDIDEGDTLTITNAGPAQKGNFNFSDTSVTYDPDNQFEELAKGQTSTTTVAYTVEDNYDAVSSGTITFTIEGENDAPVALSDGFVTTEKNSLFLNVLGNDTDVDTDDQLSITAINAAGVIGVVAVSGNGILYSPNGQFNAFSSGESIVESFSYTVVDLEGATSTAAVTVTVQGVNDGIVGTDDTIETSEDKAIDIAVLKNDVNLDGDGLILSDIPIAPDNGIAIINDNNTPNNLTDDFITYIPNANFNGTDTFTYEITDGIATATANVTVTVEPVNDAPTLVTPLADQTATEDSALSFSFPLTTFNDVDTSDSLTYTATLSDGNSLPSWLDFEPNSLTFGGQPPTADTLEITITATDRAETSANDTFVLTIEAPVTEPEPPTGPNTPIGGDSNDVITGSDADETLAGGLGDDIILGGLGDDILRGDANSSSPQGNSPGGNDFIDGGEGNDRIGGKAGNDILLGGTGNDKIWGDDGDDVLFGGLGNDQLTGDDFSGGQGSDLFVLTAGHGTDTIQDFELGIDFIGLTGELTFDDLSLGKSGQNTTISFGNEVLATLKNVEASSLTKASFVAEVAI